jgi:ABC-type multidrug transport system fused ATPase/permease subunit
MLRHYLRPFRGRVALLTILLLGSISLQLLGPQLLGRFVDAASGGAGDGSANRLYVLAALFFLAVLAQKIIYMVTVYFTEDLGWATTNALRADLTAHVLRLDMGFHKLRTPGELIERIDSDVGELAEYFSEIVVSLIGNGLLVAGILVLVFLEDWRVGLVGLAYALLILTLFRAIQNRMVRLYTRLSQANAERLGFLEEYMTGTEDVLPNGGAGYVMGRLYPLLNTYAGLQTRTYTLSTIVGATSTLLFVLTLAGTMGLAASSYLAGTMSIGTVFLLVYYVGLLESPIDSVRRHLAYIQRALASVNRTREFFELRPEVGDLAAGQTILPATAPGVVFDGVSFSYKDRRQTSGLLSADDGPWGEVTSDELRVTSSDDGALGSVSSGVDQNDTPTVLHDISFAVAPERVLGVLGRTGSGKTTLTRLLFRLYDVDVGAILLSQDGPPAGDGLQTVGRGLSSVVPIDIREIPLSELRRHVGMVTQDVQLFAASVRDNLTLFSNYDPARSPIDDGRIIDALETLGLGNWLRGLPAGLDTVLEGGGKGLSAGEAQLLAFTRVFLRDPRLVVLDEASSRLDPGTEQLLERAIDRLLLGRTGIVIAHRLRTIMRADDILILENGRVVEFGARAALAADPNSRFYRLLQTGLEEVLA